ncbi:SUF system NifU family Fe-S cluster assembly protein [Lactiplantibacillus sp. WILCCON 0030]|uniref:SUF system NifU family Fe-S cluster assembly protein n=1 Tax=Lactiplantibacillus brownii TaxID=3069269 RepID=A0ABU1ABB1_9LACO|nr:SUF system NifU family Fe-S cluster assembly protein [Lactiplantibacillus brownii]MDQ7938201.1 SUF system NifU family Fe-S cluster assembly protein [Lactiplantibacillus brownii]
MSLLQLKDLYKTLILEHAQTPHHHGVLAGVPATTLTNPTCGDVITVQLVVVAGKITQLQFSGTGCTISQASASVMTDVLLGQTVVKATALIAAFSKLVIGTPISTSLKKALGEATVLGSVAAFPTRIRCAMLAWHAAAQAIAEVGTNE